MILLLSEQTQAMERELDFDLRDRLILHSHQMLFLNKISLLSKGGNISVAPRRTSKHGHITAVEFSLKTFQQ